MVRAALLFGSLFQAGLLVEALQQRRGANSQNVKVEETDMAARELQDLQEDADWMLKGGLQKVADALNWQRQLEGYLNPGAGNASDGASKYDDSLGIRVYQKKKEDELHVESAGRVSDESLGRMLVDFGNDTALAVDNASAVAEPVANTSASRLVAEPQVEKNAERDAAAGTEADDRIHVSGKSLGRMLTEFRKDNVSAANDASAVENASAVAEPLANTSALHLVAEPKNDTKQEPPARAVAVDNASAIAEPLANKSASHRLAEPKNDTKQEPPARALAVDNASAVAEPLANKSASHLVAEPEAAQSAAKQEPADASATEADDVGNIRTVADLYAEPRQ